MVIALGLMAAFFTVFFYLPSRAEIRGLRRDTAELRRQVEGARLQLNEMGSLDREVEELEAYLAEMQRRVPRDPAAPQIVQQLARLAGAHRVRVTRLEPEPERGGQTLRHVPFRMELVGPFEGIVGLIHGLETHDRLFWVDHLTLQRKSDASTDLKAEITLTGFAGFAENGD